MVEKISGFRSSDGKVFDEETDAYIQELRIAIQQATGGNVGIADQIVSQRAMIYPVMKALLQKEGKIDAK